MLPSCLPERQARSSRLETMPRLWRSARKIGWDEYAFRNIASVRESTRRSREEPSLSPRIPAQYRRGRLDPRATELFPLALVHLWGHRLRLGRIRNGLNKSTTDTCYGQHQSPLGTDSAVLFWLALFCWIHVAYLVPGRVLPSSINNNNDARIPSKLLGRLRRRGGLYLEAWEGGRVFYDLATPPPEPLGHVCQPLAGKIDGKSWIVLLPTIGWLF